LKLAFVLECLGDFDGVCGDRVSVPSSIEELVTIDGKEK